MAELAGHTLGQYQILEEIGRGGMGTVYKGYDPALDRYVAVKVLAPHLVWKEKFIERFLREARAAARLDHPGLVTIYEVNQKGDSYYFVMQYLKGQPLDETIRQRGMLPSKDVLAILHSLAEALDYAHHRGLVHRDIKPANIIVSPEGRVTLTDFGIARAAQETSLTTTGTVLGTPKYMSPEQAKGLAVSVRSDQYSLAVVIYEMLSGRVPFDAESTLALLHKVVYEPPSSIRRARPDLPAGVEQVLAKALAKQPGDRYSTVSAFANALGQALAGEGMKEETTEAAQSPVEAPVMVRESEAEATPMPGRASARGRVPVWIWALGGVAVLALVMGIVTGVGRGKRPVTGTTPVTVMSVAEATSTPQSTSTPATTSPPGSSLESYLTFVSDRDGKREIYRLTGAGEVVRVTHTPGDGKGWSPALTPGGTVLFTSDRDGKREIYRLTGAGEVVRVTHTPGDGESWSPGSTPGGTVLFTSDRDGKQEIYRLTGAGEVVRITHTPGDGESWSPTSTPGGTVLFTSNRDGKREVCRLTEAGEVVRVTHTPGDGESWSPASTPGGTVLFTSNRDGKREVYRLTKAGEVVQVTNTPGDGESWSPVVMPDGTVLFTSDRDGKQEVYRLTGAGEVVRITHTPGDGESWSAAW